jgi:hypothetical protein
MDSLDMTGAIAAEVMRERVELGRQARLAALAQCCRPRTWGRFVRRAQANICRPGALQSGRTAAAVDTCAC